MPSAGAYTPGHAVEVHALNEKEYRSPVTGLVIKVNVEPGQEIQPSDVIVVLEAMKMETTVTAHHAGRVKSVNVAPGNPVKLHQVLVEYFPTPLRERYADRMGDHRLHREIITTAVVNDMVDRSGTTFTFRLNEETGASVSEITAAWLVVREVFDLAGFWAELEALDGQVETSVQIAALLEGRKLSERAARWLLHSRRQPFDIAQTIDFFADGVLAVGARLPGLLSGRDLAGFADRRELYVGRGVPPRLADRLAAMVPAYSAFDVVDIARGTGLAAEETAAVYFDLADRLQIARLRDMVTALPRDDRWNTMARGAIRDDLYAAHAALARDVLTVTEPGTLGARLRLASTYPHNGEVVSYGVEHVPAGFAMMFVAGILSALLGIGSGVVKVLAMDRAMHLPYKVSTTTSNFMIGVTAAASAGVYLHRGYIDPVLVMPVVLGVLAGATIGARLLARVQVKPLRLLFTAIMVMLACEMLYQGLTKRI